MIGKTALILSGLVILAGCNGKPTMIPNADPQLRKSIAVLAADAAKRFPYPADAERGGRAMGRAQVGYSMNVLEVANLSKEDWKDVTVWVNQSYVIHLDGIPAGKLLKISFKMIFNDSGQYFPLDNSKTLMKQIELYQDGKLYDIPLQLAD